MSISTVHMSECSWRNKSDHKVYWKISTLYNNHTLERFRKEVIILECRKTERRKKHLKVKIK